MPTLHVRRVPDDTYEALRRLAEDRKSTIGAEAIRLLRRALRTDRAGIRALLDEIEARRPVARRGAPPAAELIRRERNAR
jgi:plasmid stability protein